MSHSLPCVFRIPLIALFALFTLWLALNTTASLAAPAEVFAEQSLAPQPTNGIYTPTLKTASNAMLERFFGAQMAQFARQANRSLAASILVTKTVGTNPNECSTADSILVRPQTEVFYCYVVMNTSGITLDQQTVVDDKLGVLLDHTLYQLTPYGSERAAAYFTLPVTIMEDVVNIVEWSAEDSTGQVLVQKSDQAQVKVPTLSLKTTINTGNNKCGTETVISVFPNTPVVYCYTIENIGSVTVYTHTLVDSTFGILFKQSNDPLPPGAKRTIKHTTIATRTITSQAQWTSWVPQGITTTASGTIVLQVPSVSLQATVGPQGSSCPSTKAITVTLNTPVTLCYVITNTGGFTLTQHGVRDSLYTYTPFDFNLAPLQTFGVSLTVPVTRSVINNVVWRAEGPRELLAIAQDTVTITLSANGSVEVLIFYDVDGRGSHDQLEPGIPNVALSLRSPRNRVYPAITDEHGIAKVSGLPEAGNFTVTVNTETLPPGYLPTTDDRDVNVASGRTAVKLYGFVAPPGTDTDQDAIGDREETADDVDNDGIGNYQDDDADGDGMPDRDEGIPFYLIPANGPIYLPIINK